MEIYVDLLIIENIIMNYIILWVTARFSKEPSNIIKLFFSGLVGAIYSLIIFFPALKFGHTLFFKLLVSFLMVVIAFHPYKVKTFLKLVSTFYIVSFVFGGAAFALFYFTNFGAIVSNGVFYISNFPIKILLFSSIIAYVLIKYGWSTIQTMMSKENLYILIKICFDDKKIVAKALLDTGNSLYDPISKSPVIIVEFELIKELLPKELVDVFEKCRDNDISLVTNIVSNTNWVSRFRLIPFSSIGNKNGMLIGFRPDQVLIDHIDERKEIKDTIIGIYNSKLSKDESYNALLHPQVVNL